jgi:hypothetical protein
MRSVEPLTKKNITFLWDGRQCLLWLSPPQRIREEVKNTRYSSASYFPPIRAECFGGLTCLLSIPAIFISCFYLSLCHVGEERKLKISHHRRRIRTNTEQLAKSSFFVVQGLMGQRIVIPFSGR